MSLANLAQSYSRPMPHRQLGDPDPEFTPAPEGTSKPDGFEMLTRYIPTETITIYVAAMASRDQIAAAAKLTAAQAIDRIYWTGAVLTPVILALLMLVKARQAGSTGLTRATLWPLVAAVLAYLVWAWSVPGHPVAEKFAGLPALGALLLSTFLSLLDPLFTPRKPNP